MKRIVLKISGEALSGDTGVGINYNKVKDIANEIKDLHDSGDIELSIVVGAGNICRGREAIATGMNRTNADYMGMLATVINAMALQGALEGLGKEAVVMTALSMPIVTQFYTRRDCLEQLSKGKIVIFGGGIANPFFSTDTTAALRSCELDIDLILMAKNGVDGVYDRDPRKDKSAKRYTKMTHQEILDKNLAVMDLTAATLCSQNNVDIYVFDMNEKGNISKAAFDFSFGTLITNK